MKKTLLLAAVIGLSAGSYAHDGKVAAVAKDMLGRSMQKGGFAQLRDFAGGAVGEPYRLLELNDGFYTGLPAGAQGYAAATSNWLAPVTALNGGRIFIRVGGGSGSYSVTGIGGTAAMIAELQQLSAAARPGQSLWLLPVTGLNAWFFAVSDGGSWSGAQFIPLTGTHKVLPAASDLKPYTLAQVETMVKAALKITARQLPSGISLTPPSGEDNVNPASAIMYTALDGQEQGSNAMAPASLPDAAASSSTITPIAARAASHASFDVMYPNPVHQTLTIAANLDDGFAYIKVYDQAGKEVLAKTTMVSDSRLAEQVNMQQLANGTYIIAVTDGGGNVVTMKVVKN